jgi:hypothetical protein
VVKHSLTTMKNKTNGSKTNQASTASKALAGAAIAAATTQNRAIRTFEQAAEEADANLNDEQRAMVNIGRSVFASVIDHCPPVGTPEHAQYKQGEHEIEQQLGVPQDSLDPRP